MRPTFDGTVSLGNVLVVVTLLVTAVAAWVANRERTFANAAAIERLDERMDLQSDRIRALEIETAKDGH